MTSRALWAMLASLSLAGGASAAGPAPGEPKTDYRVYVLLRDPAKEAAGPDRAAELRARLEALGAQPERSGTFETPTLDGGARGNRIDVYRASWTQDEYERAVALARGADPAQVRVEPAAAPARRTPRAAPPPSAADVVAERVRRQIGIAIPSAMLRGDGLPFDGATPRDAVADDYSRAAARLGVPVRALPKDPAELARLLHAQTAPPRQPPTVVPPPSALQYDVIVERIAAEKGVDPEVLRGLLFASQGYSGGFARTTGLRGPMGLSLATGRDYGLDGRTIDDPAANIAAGAEHLKKLRLMFGGDLSRTVAAFYCGSGAVRRSRGIPPECQGYLSQFYLAYQNGAAWAIDHNAPRRRRPVAPPEPVTPPQAVGRAAREDAVAAVRGDTPPNKEWKSRKVPSGLLDKIAAAVSQNPFDPNVKVDAAVFTGLVWAEGGYSPGNKTPNEWGAVGPTQVTYSGAEPHCRETGRKGRPIFDWKGISAWNGRKNVDCGAKVLYDRTQWTASKDPIIGLALYNTQEKHWQRIIARDKVPPFPETVAYVVRAAAVACARSGKRILTPEHFENKTALRLAQAEERRLVRDEWPCEGNAFDPACRVFR